MDFTQGPFGDIFGVVSTAFPLYNQIRSEHLRFGGDDVVKTFIAATMVLLLTSAFYQTGTAVMALLGISFGIWAIVAMGRKTVNISPALRSTAQLVMHGPYRFVRHPMYTALLTFCGAYAISEFSWLGLQLWIGLVAILAIKIAYEEPMLKRRFPEYNEYAQRVKRLIPCVF